MALKASRSPGGLGLHTAGIYADMTVDGPEIGTLVMIIDRAKNLPNRRTMGKQNPYCAARLGKEAKKTDTDKRGGQTPKWDQELRFTVHDSPDYNNLKVSVFNDDKKTDLIGETIISLEEVLLPGGGQGDQWHSLNCKGRYAGEIRIELTYYDSRPKVDRPRGKGRGYSANDLANLDQEAALASSKPQQSVKRRPLPSDPTGPVANYPQSPNNLPTPVSGPRSYHTPPLHDSPDPTASGQRYHSSSFGNVRNHAGVSRRLPSPHGDPQSLGNGSIMQNSHNVSNGVEYDIEDENIYSEQQDFENFEEFDMPVSDDPYALEAVHSQNYLKDHDPSPQPLPPRNHRVLELSGSPAPRPAANLLLSHAHSAPSLGVNEHYQEMDNDFYDKSHEFPQDDGFGGSFITNGGLSSPHNHVQHYATTSHDSNYNDYNEEHSAPPPPPPVHRSSAPVTTRPASRPVPAQQQHPLARPLHSAMSAAEFPRNSNHSLDLRDERDSRRPREHSLPPGRQFQDGSPRTTQQSHYRHQSVDGLHTRYNDPRHETQYSHLEEDSRPFPINPQGFQGSRSLGPSSERPISHQQPENYAPYPHSGPSQHEPARMYDSRNQPQVRPIPLVKPRAISPQRGFRSSPHQPYHATPQHVSPQVSQESAQSAVPYSPDSFTVFNPQHSNPQTPNGGITPGTHRELSPMYNTQPTTPTPPLPQPQLPPSSPAAPADSPIIGSDGKVKDPTDHLPPSSYAPEPERKGNRPSIIVNQRNRFGPREARSVPVTTRQQHSAPSTPTATRTTPHVFDAKQSPRQPQGLGSPSLPPQAPPFDGHHGTHDGATQYGQPRYPGHGFSYDRVEVFAPPIPAKVPLDSRGGGSPQFARSNEGLGRDMAALSLDGEADSTGAVYGGRGGATRPRRSRFGA